MHILTTDDFSGLDKTEQQLLRKMLPYQTHDGIHYDSVLLAPDNGETLIGALDGLVSLLHAPLNLVQPLPFDIDLFPQLPSDTVGVHLCVRHMFRGGQTQPTASARVLIPSLDDIQNVKMHAAQLYYLPEVSTTVHSTLKAALPSKVGFSLDILHVMLANPNHHPFLFSFLNGASIISPEDEQIAYFLGGLFIQRGDYKRAIQQLQRFSGLSNLDGKVRLAYALAQSGDITQANELLDSVISITDCDANVTRKVKAMVQRGDNILKPADALECYNEALLVSNHNPIPLLSIARFNNDMDDYDNAISFARYALLNFTREPDFLPICQFEYGRALALKGNFAEAEQALGASMACMEGYVAPIVRLADIFVVKKETEKAVKFYSLALTVLDTTSRQRPLQIHEQEYASLAYLGYSRCNGSQELPADIRSPHLMRVLMDASLNNPPVDKFRSVIAQHYNSAKH